MRWLALLFFATGLDLVAQAPAAAPPRVEHAELGTAFRTACWRGDLAAVKTLYDQGAPLEGRDNRNRTPLFLACHGDPDVVAFLLAHGARIDTPEKGGDLPITHACQYGDLASAKLLIAAGANPNIANDDGQSPLMLATQGGHDDIVSYLIEQHADVNFESFSDPALFFATWNDHPSTAKLLLDAGAHVVRSPAFASLKNARLPLLSFAAQTKDTDLVDLLLAHGADINSATTAGETVLMRAVQGGDTGMIAHLLDKGADVNRQDGQGRTALMLSVNFQSPSCLQSLLDHGAKLETRDQQGRTALIWACYYIYDPNIQFLAGHGADINAADANGETPLTYAGSRGDTAMVKFLQDKGATRTDLHVFALPKPNPPLPVARSWALAVGSIYAQTNGANPQMLGDNSEPVDEMRKTLKDDWEITDKASFLSALDQLRKTGHRTDYQAAGLLLANLSDADFTAKLVAKSDEEQVEAKTIRASYLKWKNRSGLAWDLCRAANLIGFGVHAGYLSEDEAWPLLMDNARQVQSSFESWQEMSDNFLDGREVWANGVETKFAACAQLLCNPKDPNSPWNQYPWKTDLTGP